MSEAATFDLAVIGGGINGAGIARDAAGRGLRVLLVEQHDLASGTSSTSTKLIHGGLRYLEHGALRLVHEALAEREVLLRMAPHLVRPMRFILPHHKGLRPAWMLRLGLFLYDSLGSRKILPGTTVVDLKTDPRGAPLAPDFSRGFEYSDCRVDDARLVVLNAVDAAERGADIRTRTRLSEARRDGEIWRLTLCTPQGVSTAQARVLVNAAGPWVDSVWQSALHRPRSGRIRLVKGSHIVVPRLYAHDRAYIFQNADGRIVFAIPYEGDFTLIGTTDIDIDGPPESARASDDEIAYLCKAVSGYFRQTVTPEQVVNTFSGVRPLYDDGAGAAQQATREYVLDLDAPAGEAPLLNIYGGKITTYRKLAEAALKKLTPILGDRPAWTATARLPGGDLPWNGIAALVANAKKRWPALSEQTLERLVAAYGTRVDRVLGTARTRADLGPWFGDDLSATEVRYLMEHEWACTADDVLWRRSKLGLRLTPAETKALADFIGGNGRLTAAG